MEFLKWKIIQFSENKKKQHKEILLYTLKSKQTPGLDGVPSASIHIFRMYGGEKFKIVGN